MHAAERFVGRPVRASLLASALVGVAAVMSVLVPAGPTGIDETWSARMDDARSPLLEEVARLFDALGHGLGWAVTLGAIAAALLLARRWIALVAFALAEGVTSASSALMKAAIGRPRPPDALVDTVGSSFPSGHSSYGAATCVALVLLFTSTERSRAKWWVLAALGTAVMAWSRTYLNAHWLTDVIGGVLLGIGITLVVFAAAQLSQRRTRDGDRCIS